MSFKDQLSADLNTFISADEFAETHKIDGGQIYAVVDNDRLSYRSKKEYEGIYIGDILYYARVSDFVKKPVVDAIQVFDNRRCIVFDVREDVGLLEVILKQNVG